MAINFLLCQLQVQWYIFRSIPVHSHKLVAKWVFFRSISVHYVSDHERNDSFPEHIRSLLQILQLPLYWNYQQNQYDNGRNSKGYEPYKAGPTAEAAR